MFYALILKWKHFSYRLKSNKAKFTEIYATGGFTGKRHPSSGIGSSLEQTAVIRQEIAKLLVDYKIRSLVDVPCGDFTWMSIVNLEGVEYQGFDIVEHIIVANKKKYAAHNLKFGVLDIVKEMPTKADLIFCRDCLVHLSNLDALKALSNLKKSGSSYLLTTTFPNADENVDMVSARGWRPLNLQKQPFNLPEPLLLINENCTESGGIYSDKSLGLWLIKNL
ncbi:MAG: hypothetical protein CVU62_05750 [Deltaproteobacteria bacterium HGW-Deltaproteobacteria-2]|jgi:2-polyprenyl-3-methyl-5-hydroxy-6-metoxy-1,4-benzoquinol methylase|nr:MAG: hypothetical protein CVU62_05750 [Deltaproteobacteria bacterium HGW-Deltaproteobacteria-2]